LTRHARAHEHGVMRTRLALILLFFLLALGSVACRSSSGRLDRLYADLESEVAGADPTATPTMAHTEVHEQRADAVHEIAAQSDLDWTADECFKASVLLVDTLRAKDLELAAQFARRAVEKGEPRGLRVGAEAVDKLLMVSSKPQKYGTQYVFDWVLDSWRLYPTDPTTKDEERNRVGVASYAELLQMEDEMNRVHGKKMRPR
jgi:hypothetical protein